MSIDPTGAPEHPASRFRASPFETVIAFIAFGEAVVYVVNGAPGSVLALTLYVMLGVGGLLVGSGVLADALDVESAGLAMLLGSYLCLVLETWPHGQPASQAESVLVNAGGLAVAIVIRLAVVRKASRARRRAGRRARGG